MKCDNLQRYSVDIDYVPNDDGTYMDADEVNEAIAELKQKLDKTIAERDGNQVCIDALKTKLENVQASMYCDVVDANMENRRLKRALWLARAERANDRAMTCNDFAYLGDTEREINMSLKRSWMKCRMLKPSEWSKVWNNVECKCRAKAEEYK